jgi:plasmid stabilization system protein ParE
VKFSVHKRADADFEEAYAWYAAEREILARGFADEIAIAIAKILEAPARWPVIEADVRQCKTKRFPYAVVYTVRNDEVFIGCIKHLQRRPGFWRDRF